MCIVGNFILYILLFFEIEVYINLFLVDWMLIDYYEKNILFYLCFCMN